MPRQQRLRLAASAAILLTLACEGTSPTAPGARPSLALAHARGALGAPSDVGTFPAGFTVIAVSWTDNATAESGYEIHRSTTGAGGTYTLRAATGADVTTYRDSSLNWTVQYCYEVRAFQVKGKTNAYSAFAGPSCTQPISPELNAPTGLTATPTSSTTISLAWNANNTVQSGFHVERSLDGGSSWTSAADAGAGVSGYASTIDSGRTPETTVCYRVEAFNSLRTSAPSNVACATPIAAPTALTAKFDGAATVTLTWTDNSAHETGYYVERATSSSGPFEMILLYGPVGATSYADHTVKGGTTYWYYVYAIGNGASSDSSNHASVNVPMAFPNAPSYVTTYAGFEGDAWFIDVDWSDDSAVEDGYRVEKSLDGGTTWTAIGSVPANQSAFGDDRVPLELRPCYRIFAFNAMGTSPPSPVACTPTPRPPSNVQAVGIDPYTISVTWVDESNVEDGFCAETLDWSVGMWSNPYQIAGPDATGATFYADPGTTLWIRIGSLSGYACAIGGEVAATTPDLP